MIKVISIGKVSEFLLLQYFSNKNTYPDTASQFGYLETDTFTTVSWNGVISKAESLILWWRACLDGISTGHVDTLAAIDGRVYYEELEFEDVFDVLIELLYGFDATVEMFCSTLALLVAKKGR